MKKKLVFGAVLLLALALTTGTFAYTYSNTTSVSLNATFADGAWATYEPSASQPDWERVLPNSIYDSEILRPAAPGDQTSIDSQFPMSGAHWDKVDDIAADDAATYVSTSSFGSFQTDIYTLTDHQALLDTEIKLIKSITVFFCFAGEGGNGDAAAKAVIKSYGNIYEGTVAATVGSAYVTKSYEWKGNPATGKLWTWDEVNALQAGAAVKGDNGHRDAYLTQVYVTVNYEKKITQSEVPEGDLFNITPHPDYTGDLQVTIYLTNTAALIKAYSYLNIELHLPKSIEAAGRPGYKILSPENGTAAFNIEGGSAITYTLEVWGGAYHLVSPDPAQWASGWSVIPEFYCEVTQR
jgi:hypothetical protein